MDLPPNEEPPVSALGGTKFYWKEIKSEEINSKDIYYGTCSTSANVSEKVITTDDDFELRKGVIIIYKPSVTNTASNVTLNVNNTGGKEIYADTTVYPNNRNRWTGTKNRLIYYMYDGTYWVWLGHSIDYDTTTGNETTIEAGINDTKFATRQSVRNYVDNHHDDSKQDILVSGSNIKTVNNQSLLGSGNISIQGGGDIQTIIDAIYPVGSLYMSVNDVNPSVLFGGFWKKIEDKFLLGSGSNYNLGETGGSKDAIVVEHNHTQNAHTHTQNSHNHGVGTDRAYMTAPSSSSWSEELGGAISGEGRRYPYSTSTDYNVYVNTTTSSATATNQNTTATNNATGVDGTGKNMPPYLVVNVWERISSFLKTCFDADYLNNTYLSYDEDTNTLYCPSVHEYYSTQTFVNYDITSGKTLTVEFTIDNSNTSSSGADRRGVGICSGRNKLAVLRDIRNVFIEFSTDNSQFNTGKNYFTNTYSNVKLELVGAECSIWIDDEFVTSITHTLNGDIGLWVRKWQWGRVGVKDFRFSYR